MDLPVGEPDLHRETVQTAGRVAFVKTPGDAFAQRSAWRLLVGWRPTCRWHHRRGTSPTHLETSTVTTLGCFMGRADEHVLRQRAQRGLGSLGRAPPGAVSIGDTAALDSTHVGSTGVTPAGPGRVLVVDDDVNVRGLLRDFLQRRGYVVQVAANASEALAIVRNEAPDVTLLDLNMPGEQSGDSILRTLSAMTAVIVITGASDVDVARRVQIDGAVDFVAKPFSLDRLMEAVQRAMTARRDG